MSPDWSSASLSVRLSDKSSKRTAAFRTPQHWQEIGERIGAASDVRAHKRKLFAIRLDLSGAHCRPALLGLALGCKRAFGRRARRLLADNLQVEPELGLELVVLLRGVVLLDVHHGSVVVAFELQWPVRAVGVVLPFGPEPQPLLRGPGAG
eukprot:scaffold7039_cov118-Isochrysis_galbana.AAC.9